MYKAHVYFFEFLCRVGFDKIVDCMSVTVYHSAARCAVNASDCEIFKLVITFVGNREVAKHYAAKSALAPFIVQLGVLHRNAFWILR